MQEAKVKIADKLPEKSRPLSIALNAMPNDKNNSIVDEALLKAALSTFFKAVEAIAVYSIPEPTPITKAPIKTKAASPLENARYPIKRKMYGAIMASRGMGEQNLSNIKPYNGLVTILTAA